MMTKREVFEKVKAHLLAQGERAFDPNLDMCVYRAPDGKKCAAGCLIADEHYSREMDCMTSEYPIVLRALRASGVPEDAMDMICALQVIHDRGPNWCDQSWEDALAVLERKEFGHD